MNHVKAEAKTQKYMANFGTPDIGDKLRSVIESAYRAGQLDGYELCFDEFRELAKKVEEEKPKEKD